MLRAGSVSTGVTGQAASLAGYRRMVWSADESSPLNADDSSALHRYWHGGWVLPPHSQGLESCALLVCHRRLEKRSTIQGHRGGHTTTHSPQSLATLAALCVLGWQTELNRSAIVLKRTNTATIPPRRNRTHRCFTVDVSVFMAHLPGKPFRDVKFGTKSPRLLALA